MTKTVRLLTVAACILLSVMACTAKIQSLTVNRDSIAPGGMVHKGAQQLQLLGDPLQVGRELPDTVLVDAFTMEEFSFSQIKGKTALVSIVPSIDTKVCEAQTHYLGEEGDRLPDSILRITVSRDTPFAQKRFAEAAKLTDIRYLSDYREGAFGMATGLLVEQIKLLARGVMVVDRSGTVQYMQIVPQLGELPDMEKAFDAALRVSEQPGG